MQQYVRPQTLHRARLGLCRCGGVLRGRCILAIRFVAMCMAVVLHIH